MVPLNVIFVGKEDPAPWRGAYIDCGVLEDVNVLDGGMESGLPSIAVRIRLPIDGSQTSEPLYAVAQQTGRQIVTLAKILMAKYPSLMFDDAASAKDKDILGMLQELRSRNMDVYMLTREQLDQLMLQFAKSKGDL